MNPPEKHPIPLGPAVRWREALWTRLRWRAIGLDGEQVIEALMDASELIYAAGLDQAFKVETDPVVSDEQAASFDIGWMTTFLMELKKRSDEVTK